MSAAGSANVLRRRAEIPPAAGARADWLVLTGVGGIAAFALVGIAWGISAVRDQRPKAGLVEVALDNRIVQVPAGWLREPSRVAGRKLRAIELVVPLPNGETQGTTPLEKVVLMRLAPADDSLPPEERAEQLYARFLSSEAWSNPGGLILRGFSPARPTSTRNCTSPPGWARFRRPLSARRDRRRARRGPVPVGIPHGRNRRARELRPGPAGGLAGHRRHGAGNGRANPQIRAALMVSGRRLSRRDRNRGSPSGNCRNGRHPHRRGRARR